MQSPKLIVFVCLCALMLSGWSAPASAQKKDRVNPPTPELLPHTPYSDVQRDALLNGLQIVTLERSGEPRLRCELVIRGGAMFDLVGKAGLAVMTQETLLAAAPQLTEELDSLQAKLEWGIDWDLTWFRLEAPLDGFDTAMGIIGRLLVVENIRPESFNRAQQARLAQLKARAAKLTPAERADEKFLAELYGDHPYGHSVEGNERTAAAITRSDVIDFYKRFYLANNSAVVVLGNVKHERVMRAFKTSFGGWVKGPIVPATFRQPARTTKVRVVEVEAAEAPAVEWRGGVIGVKRADQDFVITALMARVLEARLKKDAAELQGSALAVKAPPRALSGPLLMSAAVPPERAAEFSRRATDTYASLATTPITEEELAAAKASLISEHEAQPIIEHLREMEAYNLPRNHALNYAARVNAITAADAQRVANRLRETNALTVVVLGRVSNQPKSETPGK